MSFRTRISANLYKDSVALMRVAEALQSIKGVRRATLVMGTPANKALLAEAGLFDKTAAAARPDDLIAVVDGSGPVALDAAFARMASLLAGEAAAVAASAGVPAPRSLALAVGQAPDSSLAMISVPGPYAAAEALKALKLGLDVFLFSDNVSVAHERAIKTLAAARGLLVMGPDCGTAILGGVPLGFANAVRPGAIGLVAASGTGLQQATCLIDRLGEGVSHAIGTGGRDLADEIGGITMLQGIDLLARDRSTRVMVLISKPPSPAVAAKVLARAAAAGKPVVVAFLGQTVASTRRVIGAASLEEAATLAVALLRKKPVRPGRPPKLPGADAARESRRLAKGQDGILGLFSGGTFAAEAGLMWGAAGRAVDLGGDAYTVGRPHPMIDPATRLKAIGDAARDPKLAVLVLDLVLGWGAHGDPAGALAPAILKAKAAARAKRRHLSVVGFVCGTAGDPQGLAAQEAKLHAAGVLVVSSSTRAAALAARIAGRGR